MARDESYDRSRAWRAGNEEAGGYGQRGLTGTETDRYPHYGRPADRGVSGNVEYRSLPNRDLRDNVMNRGADNPSYGGTGDERYVPESFRGRGPRGYQRSDQRIYEDVNEYLTEHGRIDASEIEVRVEQGRVILEGSVPNRSTKRLAEDMADRIPGVKDVENRLRIENPQPR